MRKYVLAAFLCLISMSWSIAEEGQLELELNALSAAEDGCSITFLAVNRLEVGLASVAFEVALFDGAGTIDQLVTLDFNGLAQNKTKVLQFVLPNLDCSNVGRILINDATACEGKGLVAAACLARLKTSTKTNITFGI